MAKARKRIMRSKSNSEEAIDHRNALLYPIGYDDAALGRPLVGVINSWNELNPGHFQFKIVVDAIKAAIIEAGATPFEIPITGICDGICSNTPGDRYTLPSRDLVSMEIESMVEGNQLDGMILLGSCDKVVPGMLMAVLRLNLPAVLFTGGYMKPGCHQGRMLTITHQKQAYASYSAGTMSREDYKGVVHGACPTTGACPFMGTANTMCCVAEVLGLALPGNASLEAESPAWNAMASEAGRTLVRLVRDDVRPRDLVDRRAIENAIRFVLATAGSTNAFLHLPAMAAELGLDLDPRSVRPVEPIDAVAGDDLS